MLMEYFNYLSAINNTTYNVNVAIDQGTEKVQVLHLNRAASSFTHAGLSNFIICHESVGV